MIKALGWLIADYGQPSRRWPIQDRTTEGVPVQPNPSPDAGNGYPQPSDPTQPISPTASYPTAPGQYPPPQAAPYSGPPAVHPPQSAVPYSGPPVGYPPQSAVPYSGPPVGYPPQSAVPYSGHPAAYPPGPYAPQPPIPPYQAYPYPAQQAPYPPQFAAPMPPPVYTRDYIGTGFHVAHITLSVLTGGCWLPVYGLLYYKKSRPKTVTTYGR
ncbi:hypothetical protein [Micromonospora sp. NPDC005237]|uniref:hypothetical protein n=1 Tax=Micromonospora sp. NPDC005237 TaxID=3155113 RepID=UPI0033B83063